ncbi:hypothetical protein QO239_23245 [Cupriavidus taiwanensis]|uniref:hypothetical protein n=1 Tax=Cupriavidus taiwanensis TaxID=164546 RepID=UPI002540F113|nr:hypothetical protein [Cupriavidus taiwanensis]MDK3025517.1 hypothetical protein [Cupriavidus taiwanensis]
MAEELLATRRLWKQAYLGGDLIILDQMESERFHVTTDCSLKRKEQLSSIPQAIAEKHYSREDSRYLDDEVDANAWLHMPRSHLE